MSRAGTKSNQGDYYQRLIALHWLIRLINDEDGISYIQAESNGLPGIDEYISVDDVVVVYADGRRRHALRALHGWRCVMTPVASLVASFLREWLPIHRGASVHTVDSYAHALRLLFNFASERLKVTPSEIPLEKLDASLVVLCG